MTRNNAIRPPAVNESLALSDAHESRYEADEQAAANGNRLGFRIAFGLLVANAVVTLKNVLYGPATNTVATAQSANDEFDPHADSGANPGAGKGSPDDAPPAVDGSEFPTSAQAATLAGPELTPVAVLALNRGDSIVFVEPVAGQPIRGGGPRQATEQKTDGRPFEAGAMAGSEGSPAHRAGSGGGRTGTAASDSGDAGGAQDGISAADDADGGDGGDVAEDDVIASDTPGEAEARPPSQPNRAPTVSGPVILAPTFMNLAVVVGLSDLLRNASDADANALKVVDLRSSSGTLVERSNAEWLFTPDVGDVGEVAFTYTISDGTDFALQTANLDLLPLTGMDLLGTAEGDTLVGTALSDRIDARGGDDLIIAREGDDRIDAGPGNDRIAGGDGDDIIFAGDGNDTVNGGNGNDVVYGGSGDDVIDGGAGDDTLIGEEGNDVIIGGVGRDLLSGGEGEDRLLGGSGNDILLGGDGNDNLAGDEGDDTLVGDAGADALHGGDGDDVVIATTDDGDDVIDGGNGADTYDLSGTSAAAVVDLAAGTSSSSQTGDDALRSIENVVGTSSDDAITGDDADNVLTGGAGADALRGGGGDDAFIATTDDGDDAIDGGNGADTYDLSGTSAAAVVDLAAGTSSSSLTGDDVLLSIENVVGTSSDDEITGNDADNVLTGGAGADALRGGGGDDAFIATTDDGNDLIDGGDGADTYDLSGTEADAFIDLMSGIAGSADIGEDRLSSVENVIGGFGADRIIANDEINVLLGGSGSDIFIFTTVLSAGRGRDSRDKILDFEVGDRIDLDDISREFADRFEDVLDDQGIRKFVLIKDGDAFTEPGQLRISYEVADGQEVTIVAGNIDYDTETEFEIELTGSVRQGLTDLWSGN